MKRFVISWLCVLLMACRLSAAILYVRSTDGSDADNGSTWALAKATLAGAFTAAAAGDTIYVSQAHAETQASAMTLTSPGTLASPVRVICANDGAEPPTATATTATITTTGANNIAGFNGYTYVYGVTLNCGTGASVASITTNGTSSKGWFFENSALRIVNTGAAASITFGSTTTGIDQSFVLKNTTMQFAATTDVITLRADVTWINTPSAITGATFPAALFTTNGTLPYTATISGVDLSALGSGKTLFTISGVSQYHVLMSNCKLGASVAYTTGTWASRLSNLQMIDCDSADTNYKYYYEDYHGTIRDETTIVRSSGSSDGTTAISHKFVSSANTKHFAPLYGPWVNYFANSTGATTIEAEVVTDNVTLTDADAWIEVESLNNGSFPVSTFSTDQITDPIFGTPANQTSSSVTWTTTGLTTPIKQTLSKAVTTAEKGQIRARVVLAKASTTMYVDNLRLSGSARQWQSWNGEYLNDPAAGGGTGISRSRSANPK